MDLRPDKPIVKGDPLKMNLSDNDKGVDGRQVRSERWETPPPGVNEQELAWWDEFSDVEEEFCWAQTPQIQRVLRGHYIRKIVQSIPPYGNVLEFGCGTGWLALLLAEGGARHVFGVDFSPAQIQTANRRCEERKLSERVTFYLISESLASLAKTLPAIDVLVVHGVLHHLTNQEIRKIVGQFGDYLAAPDSTVFVLEPVICEQLPETITKRTVWWLIDRLLHLPLSGQSFGIRKRCAKEIEIDHLLNRRSVGMEPRGPSPKEHPFVPGELESLFRPSLKVLDSSPVLSFSFHAAKNVLLLRLSYPRLAALVTLPYLLVVSLVERLLLFWYPRISLGGHCVFELKRCKYVRSE